jgi:DNA-binding XRE family transcriptional regulator
MKLTEFRKKNNITAIELASMLGISRQRLYEIEKGSTPSVKLAKKIEKVLSGKLTARELLGV